MITTTTTAPTAIHTPLPPPLEAVVVAVLGAMARKFAYPPLPNGGMIVLPFGLGIWM